MAKTPFFNRIYAGTRMYIGLMLCSAMFIMTWLLEWPIVYGFFFLLAFALLIIYELVSLFLQRASVFCERQLPGRLSLGDYNPVKIRLRHNFRAAVNISLTEELPFQFQERENEICLKNPEPGVTHVIEYQLRPVERGDYTFGNIIALITTPLALLQRRMVLAQEAKTQVYPSFLQFRSRKWLNASAKMNESGNVRIRKQGVSLEFDHIKEYALGDDLRKANWSATARKGNLMVNSFVDEKSQQVYCLVDEGRLMRMPFHRMTLLDYSINTTLMLANVALQRRDRIGVMTFSNTAGEFLPADRIQKQLLRIQEMLYKTTTQFLESDFENLYLQIRKKIKQRSLLLLFTNFESITGMRRQLPYLRLIAQHHLLVTVFFENSELVELSESKANNLEDIYVSTISEKFVHEKKMIQKELQSQGITVLLSTPENLSVNALNKYLEIKARRLI